jgi:hypothetical protein
MTLAKDLGKTLEEIMEISTLEFTMWAAYYNLAGKQREGRMRQHGRKYNR